MDQLPKNMALKPDEGDTKGLTNRLRDKIVSWILSFLRLLDTHNGIVTAFGTFVIAIFTVVLAFATIELKQLGEQQSADIKRSLIIARDSADAAKNAADATRDSVKLATDTAKKQLRAYVSVIGSNIDFFGTDQTVQARIRIRNTGQTPAYQVRAYTGIVLTTYPPSVAFPNIKPDTFTGTLGVGGNAQGIAPMPGPMSAAEIDGTKNGKLAIFVFGAVEYLDIYGDHHRTNYRFFFGGPSGTGDSSLLMAYTEGNEAD